MSRDRYNGVTEQRKAGLHRLEDAMALLAAVRCRGAMYMAGYAVACKLKAKLMQVYGCHHLDELQQTLVDKGLLGDNSTVKTHQLHRLLHMTNAGPRLRQDKETWRAFTLANEWMPAWRYHADQSDPEDAGDFLDAVRHVVHWLDTNI
jgi:hypothetical protein